MKNQNMVVGCVVSAIVAGGMGFYGGTKYQATQRGQFGQAGGRPGLTQNGNFNRTGDRAPSASGQGGQPGAPMMRGGAVMGEVTAKDDKSLTVRLADGSSKIVILSDSTTYRASNESSLDKIQVGSKIAAQGASNADGTTIAASIEIDPLFTTRK